MGHGSAEFLVGENGEDDECDVVARTRYTKSGFSLMRKTNHGLECDRAVHGALFTRQRMTLLAINPGYQLVCYVVMGAILGA